MKKSIIKHSLPVKGGLWISFGENKTYVLYTKEMLFNLDGTVYQDLSRNEKPRKTSNSFLISVIRELKKIEEAEKKIKTNVLKSLEKSDNTFIISQGSTNHFDPGTFEHPYLFSNHATYTMTTKTGLELIPFWNSKKMGYSLKKPTKKGSGGVIYFDGKPTNGVILGHELFHACDANRGDLIYTPNVDYRTHIEDTAIGEIRAMHFANLIRQYYNINPLREKYNDNSTYSLLNKDGTLKSIPPATLRE